MIDPEKEEQDRVDSMDRHEVKFAFLSLVAMWVFAIVMIGIGLLFNKCSAQELTPPEDLRNPRTGEAGTWIPRWVEREHVLDAHRLEQCTNDIEAADDQIFVLEQVNAERVQALLEQRRALELSQAALTAAAQSQTFDARKLERRLRTVWGLVGVSLALGATSAVSLLVLR